MGAFLWVIVAVVSSVTAVAVSSSSDESSGRREEEARERAEREAREARRRQEARLEQLAIVRYAEDGIRSLMVSQDRPPASIKMDFPALCRVLENRSLTVADALRCLVPDMEPSRTATALRHDLARLDEELQALSTLRQAITAARDTTSSTRFMTGT